jgi:hypothetical protein
MKFTFFELLKVFKFEMNVQPLFFSPKFKLFEHKFHKGLFIFDKPITYFCEFELYLCNNYKARSIFCQKYFVGTY